MNEIYYQDITNTMTDTIKINLGYSIGTGIVPYKKIVVINGNKEITITMEKLFNVLEDLFNE